MLDWITSIPGILISCGVLLLIIAIILFLLGNRKGKKSSLEPVESATEEEKVSTETVSTVTEEAPVVEAEQTLEPSVPTEEVASTESNVIDFTPAVETASEEVKEEIVPFTFDLNAASTPASEQATEEPATFDFSVTEEPKVEEKPVTIYGGNDPLENTQSVNIVEEHVPYGGTPEVNIPEVAPVVEEVQAPATELPTIEIPEVKVDTIETPAPAVEPPQEVKVESAPAFDFSTTEVPSTNIETQPTVEQPVAPTLDIPASQEQPEVVMPTIDQNM